MILVPTVVSMHVRDVPYSDWNDNTLRMMFYSKPGTSQTYLFIDTITGLHAVAMERSLYLTKVIAQPHANDCSFVASYTVYLAIPLTSTLW